VRGRTFAVHRRTGLPWQFGDSAFRVRKQSVPLRQVRRPPYLEFGHFQDLVRINKSLLSTKAERDLGLWPKGAGENASRRVRSDSCRCAHRFEIGVTKFRIGILKPKHGAHLDEKHLWDSLRPITPYPTGRFFRGTLSQALRARLRSMLSLRDTALSAEMAKPRSKSVPFCLFPNREQTETVRIPHFGYALPR
jgi:hypothetical protein